MRSVLTIMVAAILGACSPQFADRPDGDPVNASVRDLVVPDGENDVFLTLPANPWKAADPINIAQQVSATWTDPEAAETKERTTFIARIAITTSHVMVTVLDGLGRRALDIDWTESALNVTRADWLPDRIDARRLLADMFVTYWPLDDVKNALGYGMTIQQTPSGRIIHSDHTQNALITVTRPATDPWQGTATLHNACHGYTLTINSQRMAP